MVAEDIPAAAASAHPCAVPWITLILNCIAVGQTHPPADIKHIHSHTLSLERRDQNRSVGHTWSKKPNTHNFDVFDAGNDTVSLATLL